MANSKRDHKKAFGDIFDVTSDTNNIDPQNTVNIEEVKETKEEVKKEKSGNGEKKKKNTHKRSYNIPNDILEDIEKVVYMNRDIKDNTDLVILALRSYLSNTSCQELIKEYNTIKGGQEL